MSKRIEYDFPEIIRDKRKEEGWTTECVSTLSRVSNSAYRSYEDGSFIPRLDKAQRILRTLGYDLMIVKRVEKHG